MKKSRVSRHRAPFSLADTPLVAKPPKCQPYVCTFELPASCEAAYRSGDPTTLRDALVEHLRQLGRQIARDYDERIADIAKPNPALLKAIQ